MLERAPNSARLAIGFLRIFYLSYLIYRFLFRSKMLNDCSPLLELLNHIDGFGHRRSQDFVWGALFFPKKLTTFFSRRPSKHKLKLPK